MNARLGAEDPRTAATLAAFDGAEWARIAPDASLRAAALALRGSFADTVIGAMEAGVSVDAASAQGTDTPAARPPVPPAAETVHSGQRLRSATRAAALAPWIIKAQPSATTAGDAPRSTRRPGDLPTGSRTRQLLDTPDLVKTGTQLGASAQPAAARARQWPRPPGRAATVQRTRHMFPGSAGARTTYLAILRALRPRYARLAHAVGHRRALTVTSFNLGR